MIKDKTVEGIMDEYLRLKFKADELFKCHSPLVGGLYGVIMREYIRRMNPKYLPYNTLRCKKND